MVDRIAVVLQHAHLGQRLVGAGPDVGQIERVEAVALRILLGTVGKQVLGPGKQSARRADIEKAPGFTTSAGRNQSVPCSAHFKQVDREQPIREERVWDGLVLPGQALDNRIVQAQRLGLVVVDADVLHASSARRSPVKAQRSSG